MGLPRIKLKRNLALALFILGAAFCVLPELAGIGMVSAKPFIKSIVDIPLPDMALVPLLYCIPSVIIGLCTKRNYNAAIYGACLGQCQLLLPFILFFLLTPDGDALEALWRIFCGIPLTASIAGAVYSVKKLLLSKKSK